MQSRGLTMRIFKKIIVIFWSVFFFLILAAAAFVFWDNSRVVNTDYTYQSEKLPEAFDGFKIALITDFHNSKDYEQVIDAVRDSSPDIICIVGDLVSMDTTNYSNTKSLIGQLTKMAPVYYAYGNHEYYNATYRNCEEPPIKNILSGYDVIFMNNEIRTIEKDGAVINLVGYGDSIHADGDGAFWQHAEPFLQEVSAGMDRSVVSVLMLHRAQYFDEVSAYPFDLVIGGHMHGGQIRIEPIESRILKSHVGTDKYSKGEYFENGHELIISGGCTDDDGIRIFNTPEVVTITLKKSR